MVRPPVIAPWPDALQNVHEERVRFGDTDAAGIVYYANYLRYFEAGRAELMRAYGVPFSVLQGEGWFMPVVESWCRYYASAQYDDLIQVLSWVHELRSATVLIGTQIIRGETILATGGTRLGCIDAAGKPRRLHADLGALRKQMIPPPDGS